MPNRPTEQGRKRIFAEMELMVARGMNDGEIIDHVAAKHNHGHRTVQRWINQLHQKLVKRTHQHRHKYVARQVAKIQHAQRLALNASKHVNITDDKGNTKTHEVPAPDLQTLTRLLGEENRLLGLYPSRDIDVLVSNMERAVGRLASIVKAHIQDPYVRKQIVSQLREAASMDLSRRRQIEEAAIVDAEFEVKETPAEEKPDKGPSENGSSNGRNGHDQT